MITASRSYVLDRLIEERDYQDRKWGFAPTSIAEFILYMEHHLTIARQIASTQKMSDSENARDALHQIRKVTALGVACMEEHGAPSRNEEGQKPMREPVRP